MNFIRRINSRVSINISFDIINVRTFLFPMSSSWRINCRESWAFSMNALGSRSWLNNRWWSKI